MEHGWLLCPDGNVSYGPGGFAWNVSGSKRRVDDALAALAAVHGDLVGEHRGLLIGYSLGAAAAWHQLEHSAEPWAGLALINTKLRVNPSVVKAKGLQRVAFIAGQNDESAAAMSASANRLRRSGIDARFFTLEKTGHYFDDETWKRMAPALQWALEGPEGRAVPAP